MSKENMFLNVLVEFSAFLADSTSVLSFSVIGKVVCFSFFSTVKHLVATLTLPVTQGLEFGNGFEVLVFNKLKVIFFLYVTNLNTVVLSKTLLPIYNRGC